MHVMVETKNGRTGDVMPDWIPMFTLPNITLAEPIETEGAALVSTADPRLGEISEAHPSFRTYVDSFKTEFDRSLALYSFARTLPLPSEVVTPWRLFATAFRCLSSP
jgi:hypothetical protein